jgi:CubicO group peptidase (beta-lactamase class C family)
MTDLERRIEDLATTTRFSGVVRVDDADSVVAEWAFGFADRRHSIANTVDTQFAIASGVKGLTALAVMNLVESGVLTLDTTARSILGSDLPLIDDSVTIEHLLAHRSGIGDYLDESVGLDLSAYLMPVPVQNLTLTEQYLAVLDGHPQAFRPDGAFAYNNGGFVVLALIAERASGIQFHDLVAERVCGPAGMRDTAFLRSDELPGSAATGYLDTDGLRTNVLHLPVRGNGDGGIYTTSADMRAFWISLCDGRIVTIDAVHAMRTRHSLTNSGNDAYGLGFWLHPTGPHVSVEGCDAGVSFRSVHNPTTGVTYTVISNTTEGAWPVLRLLSEILD